MVVLVAKLLVIVCCCFVTMHVARGFQALLFWKRFFVKRHRFRAVTGVFGFRFFISHQLSVRFRFGIVEGERAKQIEESAADMQSRVEGFPSHPRSNEG